MPTDTQMKRGFRLPENLTGHEIICLTLHVPNDPVYLAAIEGALSSLWSWWVWEKSNTPGDTRANTAARYIHETMFGTFTYSRCLDECEECDCPDSDTEEPLDCEACEECD